MTDRYVLLAIVLWVLAVAGVLLGVWWLATVAYHDPDLEDVERHLKQRDALGRAAARARR